METARSSKEFFETGFLALTDQRPFRWQARLFTEHLLLGRIPEIVDVPTGLGKTSVIVTWVLALAWQARNRNVSLPRRLIYVVDRRTVVDQATDVAERLRHRLRHGRPGNSGVAGPALLYEIRDALGGLCLDPDDDASPLAISTLRGERADNREWQADPSRPTIIVGTIDMIGSRLLFSGYGVSRRMRPFHAGLLGQDALLVHDEAHLSVPFSALIRDVARRQPGAGSLRPLRIIELSATPREFADDSRVFTLAPEDLEEPSVAARVRARKHLRLLDGPADESAVGDKLVDLALAYKDNHQRVLIYVRPPAGARMIAEELTRELGDNRVGLLTGTVRGHERDALANSPLFQGFRPTPDRRPPDATQYLIATSAGEVGVDLDADHLICDLATLDAMIQRLGRVNRLGDREADVHVVVIQPREPDGDRLTEPLAATRQALASLPLHEDRHDASPQALRKLADRTNAFAPVPRCVPVTDIVLDNLSLTRLDDLPGRPLPERWLHGIEAGEPDLYVAWREEVNDLVVWDDRQGRLREAARGILRTVYEKHPILAREHMRGPLSGVKAELERIARRWRRDPGGGAPLKVVWIPVNGEPVADDLSALLEKDDGRWPNATIVLPPQAGGLDRRGMLDGSAIVDSSRPYDVADVIVEGFRRRSRVRLTLNVDEDRWSARWLGRDQDASLDAVVAGVSSFSAAIGRIRDVARPLALKDLLVWKDAHGDIVGALILLAAPGSPEMAQDNPASSLVERTLQDHLADTRRVAEQLLARIGLLAADSAKARQLADAVVLAAAHHDRGKNRDTWQADIGNSRRATGWQPLAKSGRRGFISQLSGKYRHEFGSLREAMHDPAIVAHPERDLILHLIAAHHGWARPHFLPEQWDIADGVTEDDNAAVAAEAMRRFARLQRRFGHWGLAWLEALLRTADYAATEWLARSATPTVSSGSTS